MMSLSEFIASFKSAVSENDWQRVALLDASLQSVVKAASLNLDAVTGMDRQAKVNQFERLLEELNGLYVVASQEAISDRDALAVTIAEASKGMVGAACYQNMQQHTE